jgi:DNA modification methylase
LQTTPLDKIKVEDRQRKVFVPKPIEDLAESIATKGLLHPIVLNPNDDDTYTLVAGERRLRAIQQLHEVGAQFQCNGTLIQPDHAPFILVTDLDEVGRKEAELEENILREDLTWQERNDAIAELHRLRERENPEQSRGDTARELAERTDIPRPTAYRAVQNAMILDNFKEDEEVQRARTESEAVKIATRKLEEEFRAATHHPTPKRGSYACIQGDCREILGTLKPGMHHAIIADPPYGMGADEFGDAAQNKHHYQDDTAYALDIAEAIFSEGHRVTREHAALLMFCDIDVFPTLKRLAETHGWAPWRTPIVWSKGAMGHAPDPNRGPKRTHELILYARKGDMRVKAAFSDVITVPPEKERYHAAQKPVALYKYLLSQFLYESDHVLDPCCGAGTIFYAAEELKLRALGIEENERFFKLSQSIALGRKG